MRLPIRNKGNAPLTIIVEPICDEYEVPAGGEAVVILEDGLPHSIDVYPDHIRLWDEGADSDVEIVRENQQGLFEALSLARVWLYNLGAANSAQAIEGTIDRLVPHDGYLHAHARAFGAFHMGFRTKEAETAPIDTSLPPLTDNLELAPAYDAGGVAAYLNNRARSDSSFPGPGTGPLDTDTARSAFEQATMVIEDLIRAASS